MFEQFFALVHCRIVIHDSFVDCKDCIFQISTNAVMVSDFDKYERLSKLEIKLNARFTDLARNFYITPTARTRLQLDNLELETKSVQSQSIIQKLINAKKAQ